VSIGGGGGAGADKPWGEAIGSAILVNLCTLFGVVLTIPVLRSCSQNHPDAFGAVTSAFAAGAILACAFYLILLEASHMTGGDTEGQMAVSVSAQRRTCLPGPLGLALSCTSSLCERAGWRDAALSHAVSVACARAPQAIWGSLVMGGFLLATALDTLVSIFIGSAKISTTANTKDGEGTDIVNVLSMGHRTRLLCGILVGDFLHNLCDGFFIGAAFLGCGSSMGWSVTAATIYHELAQEIADYVVLTDPKRGALKPVIALTINFISGTSVVFGTLIILAQDSISHTTIGYILAFSGGVYIQIGATECMSRVNELTTTKSLKLAALAAFVIGATAIALVLFDHQHCTVSVSSATGSATAAADPHAGHGH
jgi:zinc transporter ZupT